MLSQVRPSNPEDRYLQELVPILVGLGPNGDVHIYGSCFVLWPNLLLTAKHVAEQLLRPYGVNRNGVARHMEIWAVQVMWERGEHHYVVWNVVECSMSPLSDLAILTAIPRNHVAQSYQWKSAPCTLKPPAIGEVVHAFGIVSPSAEGSRVGPDGKIEHIELNVKRLTATAHVLRAHSTGRDKGFLRWPTFEVDVRFDHCMSGALVINSRSEACGVVCAANTWDHTSHVTMLFPMMSILVDFARWRDLPFKGLKPLLELARHGTFTPRLWDRIRIDGDPATPEHTVSIDLPRAP